MNFKDIKLHSNDEYNTFIFNGQEIKVIKYLPIEEKFDLIMTAIQKSIVDGVYNPIRLKAFVNLNIVYLYTDIVFDIEDRVDEGALYDNLVVTGLLDEIKAHMEESELHLIQELFLHTLESERHYRSTAAAIISKLVDDLPKNAEAARETVENFDKDKYAEVLNFMKALKQ